MRLANRDHSLIKPTTSKEDHAIGFHALLFHQCRKSFQTVSYRRSRKVKWILWPPIADHFECSNPALLPTPLQPMRQSRIQFHLPVSDWLSSSRIFGSLRCEHPVVSGPLPVLLHYGRYVRISRSDPSVPCMVEGGIGIAGRDS